MTCACRYRHLHRRSTVKSSWANSRSPGCFVWRVLQSSVFFVNFPFCFVLVLVHPFHYDFLGTFLSPSPSLLRGVTQVRGHEAGSSPTLLTINWVCTRLHFYREKTPAISSLVDSHRITPAIMLVFNRRSLHLIPFFLRVVFLQINSNVRPTWDSKPRTNSTIVAFQSVV